MPQTVAGWVALGASLVAVLAIPFGWGKMAERFRRHGERMGEIEKKQNTESGHREVMQTDLRDILAQHGALIEKVGEARGEGLRCREDYTAVTSEIGGKIDQLRQDMSTQTGEIRERLVGVETKLAFVVKMNGGSR